MRQIKNQIRNSEIMMKLTRCSLYVYCCVVVLSACSGNDQKTLGSLKYVPEKEAEIEFEKLDHQEVRQEYKELLDVFEDEKLKEQIERRIADVYMLEGEHDLNKGKQKSSYYVDAIKAYRNILDRFPDSPDNAEVLYQLSKAYDMEGNQDEALEMLLQLTTNHPTYPNLAESYFRLGDIYFNKENYAQSANAYTYVTQLSDNKFSLNSHYMLGWSQYKRLQFSKAFQSFAFVLNELLGESESLDNLTKSEKPLAEDSIHSMSLSLDKIGGAASIATNELLANKPYVWLIYEDLGDYYLGKQLYEASAETYRLFLQSNTESKRAPLFHNRLITTYVTGGFPHQALGEKENFVRAYGITSNYYTKVGIDQDAKDSLNTYLDELARFNYTLGQESIKTITKLTEAKNPKADKIVSVVVERNTAFLNAADFYGEYAQTFPEDVRVDEVLFFRAESFFLAERYDLAITDYERVAYDPHGDSADEHRADSGYAAVISYQRYIDTLSDVESVKKPWQLNAVDSMLRFAETFHTDERSPTVLTNTSEFLFSLNEYQRALDVSSSLINNNASLDPTLKKTAYGIMAHSNFKLENFAAAQTSYIAQRELTAEGSEEYLQITERLASSIYKNSEVLLAGEDKDAAIQEFLKVKALTPDSPVRIIAQYDATSLLLELERWPEAIHELTELMSLFPDHELAEEFPRKLAFAYRSDENWSAAAAAYLALYEEDKDPEIQREALFVAAEMYEKNKSYDTAITYFKRYAYLYEQPFETRMEARYRLAINYQNLGDTGKKLYWLRRIIGADEEAGSQRNDRSRWLAAWAHMEYGDYFAEEFANTRLYLPLVKSLPRKQDFLEKASTSYQKSADLGFLEFITMSSYKLAGLYSSLATDLRNAPKPKGLSSDDLVTYTQIIGQQAQPLDELAAELHLSNIERAWSGDFNEWIDRSFEQLQKLQPQRFNKNEVVVSYGDAIR